MRRPGRRAFLIIAVATAALALGLSALWVVGSQRMPPCAGSTWRPLVPPAPRGATATGDEAGAADDVSRPGRVILFIGDGMGVGALSTAAALGREELDGLAMTRLPVVGLVSTSAADNEVPDSAASGTAMATGCKAPRGALSMLADGRRPLTLFEAARRRGLATGLVTNSALVDATPAAFVTHVPDRKEYGKILAQMLASGTEVMIGGDWADRAAARVDPRYTEMMNDVAAVAPAGLTVARTAKELAAAPAPVIALLPARPGSRHIHGPPLAVTARRALELLDPDPDGFLLMVECGEIDRAGHENDVDELVAGVHELDAAVEVGLDYAAARGGTLLLVTADHDSGGPGITSGPYAGREATVRWLINDHTALWVPLLATGPGADQLGGVRDNTDIAPTLARLLGLEPFPPSSP